MLASVVGQVEAVLVAEAVVEMAEAAGAVEAAEVMSAKNQELIVRHWHRVSRVVGLKRLPVLQKHQKQ